MVARGIVVAGNAGNQLLGAVDKASHRVAVGIGVAVDAGRNLLSASIQVASTLGEGGDTRLKAGVLFGTVADDDGGERGNLSLGVGNTRSKAGRCDNKALLGVVNGSLHAGKAGVHGRCGPAERGDRPIETVGDALHGRRGRQGVLDCSVGRRKVVLDGLGVALGGFDGILHALKRPILARVDADKRHLGTFDVRRHGSRIGSGLRGQVECGTCVGIGAVRGIGSVRHALCIAGRLTSRRRSAVQQVAQCSGGGGVDVTVCNEVGELVLCIGNLTGGVDRGGLGVTGGIDHGVDARTGCLGGAGSGSGVVCGTVSIGLGLRKHAGLSLCRVGAVNRSVRGGRLIEQVVDCLLGVIEVLREGLARSAHRCGVICLQRGSGPRQSSHGVRQGLGSPGQTVRNRLCRCDETGVCRRAVTSKGGRDVLRGLRDARRDGLHGCKAVRKTLDLFANTLLGARRLDKRVERGKAVVERFRPLDKAGVSLCTVTVDAGGKRLGARREVVGAGLQCGGTGIQVIGATGQRSRARLELAEAVVEVLSTRLERIDAVGKIAGTGLNLAHAVIDLLGGAYKTGVGSRAVTGNRGSKGACTVDEARGAVLELGGAVVELAGAVLELAEAVVEGDQAVLQVGRAADELGRSRAQLGRAVLERRGAVLEGRGAVDEARGAVLEGDRAVSKLVGTVKKRRRAVLELTRTVIESHDAVLEVCRAADELSGTVEKLGRAVLQLGSAVLELLGTVVEVAGTVDKLTRAVLQCGDAVDQIGSAVLEVAGAVVGILEAIGQFIRTVNCILKAVGELTRTINCFLKVSGRVRNFRKNGVEIGLRNGGVELRLHARDRGRRQHGGDEVVRLVVHENDRALLGVVVLGGSHLFGEVGRNDELHVITAVFHAFLGILGVGIHPAHALICVFHGLNKVIAHLERRTVAQLGPFIEVDNSDRNLVHVSVRVVEGPQVQGAIQQRHEGNGCHRNLHDCGSPGILEVEQRKTHAAEGVTHS